jgi:hypothetical protein
VAELTDGLLHDPTAVLGPRHVGLDGDAATPARLHRALGLLQTINPARADRDIGTGAGQPSGKRHPETRGGACDHRHLAVEREAIEDARHEPSSISVRCRVRSRRGDNLAR